MTGIDPKHQQDILGTEVVATSDQAANILILTGVVGLDLVAILPLDPTTMTFVSSATLDIANQRWDAPILLSS